MNLYAENVRVNKRLDFVIFDDLFDEI